MILASIVISTITVLVMAEEFNQLPKSLQHFSSMLVHNRNSRNILICGVIIIMSSSISLSLLTFQNEQLDCLPDHSNNTDSDEIQRTSLLRSNPSIIISNLNVFENGGLPYNNDQENNNFQGRDLVETKNKQEIILNLFLTATIHHNITLNGIQINDMLNNYCGTNCDEQRIKDIVKEYVEMIRTLNSSTNELESDKDLLNNITDDGKCSSNMEDCTKHAINKRSILPEYSGISRYKRSMSKSDCDCRQPEYIVFMWVLCLIALATALKLYYLIKTVLAVVMVVLYAVLIFNTNVYEKETSMKEESDIK